MRYAKEKAQKRRQELAQIEVSLRQAGERLAGVDQYRCKNWFESYCNKTSKSARGDNTFQSKCLRKRKDDS